MKHLWQMLLVTLLLPVAGCSLGVDKDVFVIFGTTIEHKQYTNADHANLVGVYTSKIAVSGDTCSFTMNVQDANEKKVWGYKVCGVKNSSDKWKPEKTQIFDKNDQMVNEFPGVPREFPTGVEATKNLVGDEGSNYSYKNFALTEVTEKILLDNRTINFYVIDKQKPTDVLTGEQK